MIDPAFYSRLRKYVKQRKSRVFVFPRPILRIFLLGCLTFLLIACGGTTPTPTTKNPTSTATPVPPGQVLFQADWSHGLAGWQATGAWKVANGALQSDAGPALSITIPYQPTTPYYAVEYSIQIISVPRQGGYFQLVAAGAPGKDGYQAFINELRPITSKIFSIHPSVSVTIEPVNDMDSSQQIKDYEPGTQLHTYRVEVRGGSVLFFIDDERTSAATSSVTPKLSTGPLELQCSGVVIRISNLRITTV